MKIAILGGGFAGLSVAWHLLNSTRGSVSVDLFDPNVIGKGPSALSSGLLHPYAGRHARLSWGGEKGMRETHRLLTEAARGANRSLILSKGILRPAISSEQIEDFQASAHAHEDTEWWDKKRCEKEIPGLSLPEETGGLYIKEGLTVDVPGYLEGLWQACARLGTQHYKTTTIKQEELQKYDRILFSMGPMTNKIPLLKNLPLTPLKGQVLELAWPENLPPLPVSLISKKYLVMSKGRKSCHVGATYERGVLDPKPDQKKAEEEILPAITSFFPPLEGAKILGCRAGFRASSPNHLPMAGQVSPLFYFFTCLGSKGLLYHAWLGKRVARMILDQKASYLPDEVRHDLQPPQLPDQS
ncbi:MAG: tRNA 5-methylaminomethyl-2-thiouridine biosynthesis bifunctional protein MnmC [Chlamydiae bacterium]|nr:tRNA 5-methylaminomethyl-2-thiouridine biosynthesis bifunctional protein MnmC [Chlamydiota bacterium]